MKDEQAIVPVGQIERSILLIRGQKIILDVDLARLYGVGTKVLNQAVKRNVERFPDDFMFRLTWEEATCLRSQIVTSNVGSGWDPSLRSQIVTLEKSQKKGRRGAHLKYLPSAFTEHGAIMAASVLNSPQAVKVSVFVVRAFVKLREMLSTHKELARKLDDLERKLQTHDRQIVSLVEAIRELMAPPERPRGQIGYAAELRAHEKARRARGAVR